MLKASKERCKALKKKKNSNNGAKSRASIAPYTKVISKPPHQMWPRFFPREKMLTKI